MKAILLIDHGSKRVEANEMLADVRAMCDRVTVMRGGVVHARDVDPTTISDAKLVEAVVGRHLPPLRARPKPSASDAGPALETAELRRENHRLRRLAADVEGADAFLALTEGDNRNVMAAQVAMEKLSVGRAVAKINDPVRAAAYAELGIATVCRTTMLTDAILAFRAQRPTGMPSVTAPVPHVHDEPAEGGRATAAPRLGAQPVSSPPEA